MFNNWCTDTEASRAMLGFAIQRLLEARFFGRHAKENPASGRVMKKLGFVYQKDGTYSSFDGARTFDCKEYILEANRITSQGTGLLR
jgi:ribosomal-protein-alanine N-acetyltransferase